MKEHLFGYKDVSWNIKHDVTMSFRDCVFYLNIPEFFPNSKKKNWKVRLDQ